MSLIKVNTIQNANGTTALTIAANGQLSSVNTAVANVTTLNATSGVLATQNGMTGIAKAWAVFNAQTQTLINSFNVSSITYNAMGIQTINFTTAMPNSNYVVSGSASLRDAVTDPNLGIVAYGRNSSSTLSTTACTINAAYPDFALANFALVGVVFHGN